MRQSCRLQGTHVGVIKSGDQYLFLASLVGLVLSTTTLLPDNNASLQAETHFCHVPRISYRTKIITLPTIIL